MKSMVTSSGKKKRPRKPKKRRYAPVPYVTTDVEGWVVADYSSVPSVVVWGEPVSKVVKRVRVVVPETFRSSYGRAAVLAEGMNP